MMIRRFRFIGSVKLLTLKDVKKIKSASDFTLAVELEPLKANPDDRIKDNRIVASCDARDGDRLNLGLVSFIQPNVPTGTGVAYETPRYDSFHVVNESQPFQFEDRTENCGPGSKSWITCLTLYGRCTSPPVRAEFHCIMQT